MQIVDGVPKGCGDKLIYVSSIDQSDTAIFIDRTLIHECVCRGAHLYVFFERTQIYVSFSLYICILEQQ